MRKRGEKTYVQNALWLSKIRRLNKLSFRQLAKDTGVHYSKIHRIEHGKDASAIDYVTLMMWATSARSVALFGKDVGRAFSRGRSALEEVFITVDEGRDGVGDFED